MSFSISYQLLLDDDVDNADDFDIDFDDDYEYLSDEEFEITIEYDDYDSLNADFSGRNFCIDDDIDGFVDFDASEETLTGKDYIDE